MSRKKTPAKLYTVADIADIKTCDPSSVKRAAKRLGITSKLGHVWVFSEADKSRVLAEINDRAGNPEMGEGQGEKYCGSRGRPKRSEDEK